MRGYGDAFNSVHIVLCDKVLIMIPHSKIRSALRKLWMYSPERKQCLENGRISRGMYRCDMCSSIIGAKFVAVDHIQPLGPSPQSRNAEYNTSWDRLIERLFCGPEGLRLLCGGCHSKVTKKQKSPTT